MVNMQVKTVGWYVGSACRVNYHNSVSKIGWQNAMDIGGNG